MTIIRQMLLPIFRDAYRHFMSGPDLQIQGSFRQRQTFIFEPGAGYCNFPRGCDGVFLIAY